MAGAETMIRRSTAVPACTAMALLVIFAPLIAWSPARADEETGRINRLVDERLGLLDRDVRLWKIPVRFTASRSPYFQPGLPPYRQQPEKAQDQPPPVTASMPDPEPATPPPGSGGGSPSDGSSTSGGGSSDSGVSSTDDSGSSSSGSDGFTGTPPAPDPEPDPGFGPSMLPGTS